MCYYSPRMKLNSKVLTLSFIFGTYSIKIHIHSAVLNEQYNQFLGKLYGTFNRDISGKLKAILIQLG